MNESISVIYCISGTNSVTNQHSRCLIDLKTLLLNQFEEMHLLQITYTLTSYSEEYNLNLMALTIFFLHPLQIFQLPKGRLPGRINTRGTTLQMDDRFCCCMEQSMASVKRWPRNCSTGDTYQTLLQISQMLIVKHLKRNSKYMY